MARGTALGGNFRVGNCRLTVERQNPIAEIFIQYRADGFTKQGATTTFRKDRHSVAQLRLSD